ncbi:MAG: HNH endonuclease signature motif containing protein [Patescibacteria group bacterium]
MLSNGFSAEIVEKVWQKGLIVLGQNSNLMRKDACGAFIKRNLYGVRDGQSGNGWEIDHIDPNGSDDLSNLRPLQWYNNVTKSDGVLKCAVRASA